MKYIDYGTMQSDAQRRVLEMQRRAQNAVYYRPPVYQPVAVCEQPAAPSPAPDNHGEVSSASTANRPPEDTPDCSLNAACAAVSAENQNETNQSIENLLARDPEQVLLLTIFVLLIAEKADVLLILALAYLLL